MKKLFLVPILALGLTPTLRAQGEAFPADLRALLPKDASVLVRFASLDEMEATARSIATIVAPEMLDEISLDALFAEMPPEFDRSLIDTSRPSALSVGKIDISGQEPALCLMIPSYNPAGLAELFKDEMPSSRIFAGYLGVSSDPTGYPETDPTSTLPDRIPAGLIAGTVNMRPLLDEMDPMIKAMFGMGRGMAIGEFSNTNDMPPVVLDMGMGMINSVFDFATDVVDSLTDAQFSVQVENSVLAIDYNVNFAADSPIAKLKNEGGPRFYELRRFMDMNAQVSQVSGFDLGNLSKALRPVVDKILDAVPVPEEGEAGPFANPKAAFAAAREVLDQSMVLMAYFGDGMVTNTNMDLQGNMNMQSWIHGVKGNELAGALSALFEVEMARMVGLNLDVIETTETTQRLALSFDDQTLAKTFALEEYERDELAEFKAMFFSKPIEMSFTTVAEQTLVVVNGGLDGIKQALETAKQTLRQNSLLMDQIQVQLGDSYPFSASHYQLGPYIAGYDAMMSRIDPSELPPQEYLDMFAKIDMPLAIYLGFDGTSFRNGVKLDFKNARQLIELIEELEREESGAMEAVPLEPAR
jgi:hypothetical protein